MRTAPVHVLFLNAQDGLGADIAVHVSIARTLDRTRVRVSAATSHRTTRSGASAREAFESIPDLTLLPLELGRSIGRERGFGRVLAGLDNVRGVASLISLAWWCRKNDVNVVHVTERPRQALFGLLLARMAGCACLIHAHTSHHAHDDTRLANWRLRQADAVVGVSKFTAGTFRDVGRLPANHVCVFRPATTNAGRLSMRARLGIPADVPLIGCVARLTRWKSQATLLEAFASVRRAVPNARLVLPGLAQDSAPDGNGDYRDYLVRRIAALGLQETVTMPGFISQREMPAFYSALDVLAHPAIEEPFGLAIVEAMASSRPVVAVAGGGVPEIIRHGVDGLLVPTEDPSAMAKAITQVLRDPDFASRLSLGGRTRVLESFTPEIQAAAMVRVYDEVVGRPGRAETGSTQPFFNRA